METLDYTSAGWRSNPYQSMARVREAGPLCVVAPYGYKALTRYDDCVAVLKNPKLFSSVGVQNSFPPLPGAELFTNERSLIGNDPPDHTRVRRLIQKAFTVQEMNAWVPKLEALAKSLIMPLKDRAEFDLIADLAMPLPVIVISAMLGVDNNMRHDFKRWSDDMVSIRSVQIDTNLERRAHREQQIVASCREFTAYFEDVIARRRSAPDGQDLISAMVRASDAGQILKGNEVLGLTRLMLVAGNETTTNLLGNAVTALLTDRDQWQALVDDPDLAAAATEETLRYDGPVLQLLRRCTQATEIGGQPIAEGELVAPLLAAANRDPRHFPEPERFDLSRKDKGHIAFGGGVHLCVGAPLARLETNIALTLMAEHVPDLTLTGDQPVWLESFFLRGHKSLRLRRTSLEHGLPTLPRNVVETPSYR